MGGREINGRGRELNVHGDIRGWLRWWIRDGNGVNGAVGCGKQEGDKLKRGKESLWLVLKQQKHRPNNHQSPPIL